MPLVARGDATASVATDHVNPPGCGSPSIQTSNQCSPNVFVEGVGVVRIGDIMNSHATPALVCLPHAPPLNTSSPNVFANGKLIGRVSDTYAGPGSHVISQVGQSTVRAN